MAKKMQNFIEFNSSNEKIKDASRVGERGSPAKKKNQKLNARDQLVEHLPAHLVVLEQAKACAGGAHDDGPALAYG